MMVDSVMFPDSSLQCLLLRLLMLLFLYLAATTVIIAVVVVVVVINLHMEAQIFSPY